ncbi:hypothetical protein GE21DRAFT_1103925 [Neurospora crassa]|nr:hypothetical protein GE21DRAFT_1103925 [Neurospora crassa]
MLGTIINKIHGRGDRIILPIHNDGTYRTLFFKEIIRSCDYVKNDGTQCCLFV